MSEIVPWVASCPRCGAVVSTSVFESLNAERIPEQAEMVLAGSFERRRCAQCDLSFQPEHRMLYSDLGARAWIVMYPPEERRDFATLERGVELVLEQSFAQAPPQVAQSLTGVRPRLVFGQHMLAEAVRTLRAGLSPALLECAKLLALRQQLDDILALPVCELCFEGIADDRDVLVHGVYDLERGDRVAEVAIPAGVLAEVRARQPEFETSHAALFDRPYVSIVRYLAA